MKLLSLTNDLVFKEFLERELPLLRSMLGAVLGHEVAELTLINNELHGELAHDKTIVIDVRVVLASGKRIIVDGMGWQATGQASIGATRGFGGA